MKLKYLIQQTWVAKPEFSNSFNLESSASVEEKCGFIILCLFLEPPTINCRGNV